ncbi:hypothetical protein BABINDRAFT_32241 [Babjeviella inositovora NRRL Y-12698]|uniref:Formate/nitrite transporter n=1 Tax=Babjeviella inositovora NRRL Y-12698 TaxID=984486 RepID=A0A1E3QW41_9ASCO|nr:uncharacterized protein BABINDRAFT_32241 [Babjeviella inositovora NRRL Y-12698]ODQ81889.1 hypothetical protein BABINDRAFT_32241 [Babjeviella inositovora NRRL Y-12698]
MSDFMTPHETALACVATCMKKARLRPDTLIVSSLMAGVLFSTGGMLHTSIQSFCPNLMALNPGLVHLLQGIVYPIGLFYVVIMGVDLFNANVFYFTVGVLRGAVTIFDLLISWSISWLLNLVGNIFVCYIVCHFSTVTLKPDFVDGSVAIAMEKITFRFHQTLIKGIAGNFFVSLSIYLQLMAKPLHVKFLLMSLPIFSFVALGFTHVVADMFLVTIGMINGADIGVGTYIWKLLLPGTLGNIIGGGFFGLVFPWYLHLVVVERDAHMLKLPKYDERDEQPELGVDSRIVRSRTSTLYGSRLPTNRTSLSSESENKQAGTPPEQIYGDNVDPLDPEFNPSYDVPKEEEEEDNSPSGVFPVLGMGPPLQRERTIASAYQDSDESLGHIQSHSSSFQSHRSGSVYTARDTSMRGQLMRVFTRTKPDGSAA